MAGPNILIYGGNLTRDVEVKRTHAGFDVAEVCIAHNSKKKNGDDDTIFLDCTAFGKQAELVAKFFQKGSYLEFRGRLKYSKWTAPDGQNRNKTSAIIDEIIFTPKPKDTRETLPADDWPEEPTSVGSVGKSPSGDDIPF